jgi:hypothetical protein
MEEMAIAAATFGSQAIPKIEDWCSGGEYGKVNRQFLFTIHNQTDVSLKLVE